MSFPGVPFDASGRLLAEVAANPTPAAFLNGVGISSTGRLCIATGAAGGTDTYSNGFRMSPAGAIRGSVTAQNNLPSNGFQFRDDGVLYISNGTASPEHWSGGLPFSTTGRLILGYP